ncbi:HvfC/BufC N-terminal domain-containing protein [Pseudotabrizicola formosa]|uniref:HvfC/BufC N-terminal domain-containing protein n=1 Tax=Pseudotabrizicola formosa TaxID=2030009 RepID=UPI000CD0CA42|nr:DNA-binding domain-containing protein [Pseudotabrizicola formosa]
MSQSAFAQAVLMPDAPLPPGLVDPQGRPAPRRFDVYRNTVAASLVAALEEGFPVVRQLVGAPFFAAMALVVLRAHPPEGPVLSGYGAAFPTFLEQFPPVAHLGYLPDMARLELLVRDSYHAADAVPLAAEALAALPVPALLASRIGLAPSLRLMPSRWPVQAIWCAHQAGGAEPPMQPGDVVVLRPEFDPRPHLLPAGGLAVIRGLHAGLTLEAALDAAPGADLTAVLTLLLRGRAIVELRR